MKYFITITIRRGEIIQTYNFKVTTDCTTTASDLYDLAINHATKKFEKDHNTKMESNFSILNYFCMKDELQGDDKK